MVGMRSRLVPSASESLLRLSVGAVSPGLFRCRLGPFTAEREVVEMILAGAVNGRVREIRQ